MRAAKTVQDPKSKVQRQNLKPTNQESNPAEVHISGAEGLYKKSAIQTVVNKYIERALNHPRGKADKVIITIENIKQRPRTIISLPVVTVENATSGEAEKIAERLLQSIGISKQTIRKALILIKKKGMRGAVIITAEKGNRIERDRKRGIRVSRLGITNAALKELSSQLSKYEINTETVQEALVLASKVSSCNHVIAELCVSDDPDYTTGYVASRDFGYVRIPHIKNKGSRSGGRAFFVKEGTDFEDVATYLEKRPVIVGKTSCCRGIIPFDEVLNYSHM